MNAVCMGNGELRRLLVAREVGTLLAIMTEVDDEVDRD